MSHSKIRKDKRCQNCGHFVADRFCPECGQENVETRQRFHYLFVHFMQDFVHYDSKFWHTTKALFLPTAKLTRDYLAGKRKSQVNPVQLYIFISFAVFFIPHILPDFNEHPETQKHKVEKKAKVDKPDNDEPKDDDYTPIDLINDVKEEIGDSDTGLFGFPKIKTVEQLDSIQNTLPKEKKLSLVQYVMYKKLLGLAQMDNMKDSLIDAFMHNFPKAIFLYMPIFAFWLWLFHSKKKWFYFDHGIYTLHYFSFILLSILLFIIIRWLCVLFHVEFKYISFAMLLYFIYYFFHSHRRMYGETRAISRLICIALFFINTVFIFIFLMLYVVAVAILIA